ncbi:MAG: hypothetical protein ABIG66_03190 [Candidatus Kerfeldbacteria bacterium]
MVQARLEAEQSGPELPVLEQVLVPERSPVPVLARLETDLPAVAALAPAQQELVLEQALVQEQGRSAKAYQASLVLVRALALVLEQVRLATEA